MRGVNCVVISGDVKIEPIVGKTKSGVDACAFIMVVDDGRRVFDVRVNVYGEGLVKVAADIAQVGNHVLVVGELLSKATEYLEIVAAKLICHRFKGKEVSYEQEGQQEQ